MEFEETLDFFIKNARKEGVCAGIVDCYSSTGEEHGYLWLELVVNMVKTWLGVRHSSCKTGVTDSGEGTSRHNSSLRKLDGQWCFQ